MKASFQHNQRGFWHYLACGTLRPPPCREIGLGRRRAPLRRTLIVVAGFVYLGLLLLASAQVTAQTYSIVHDFADGVGGAPGAPVTCAGTTLYGLAESSLFKVNTDGTSFAVLYDPGFHVGGPLPGDIALSGSTVYVAIPLNSPQGSGRVYRIASNGTGYTLMKQFTADTDGGYPIGLVLSGNTLFGTASAGGNSGLGVIFKINTDGSGFAVLKHFAGGSDGAEPRARLVLSDTVLYGTTYATNANPPYGAGTVFKVNTDGSGYTVLHQFSSASDGAGPAGPLLLSEGTLYGTTTWGGLGPGSGGGTVYGVGTNGSGFAALKYFTGGSDGELPTGPLALYGRTLFGATHGGGTSGDGTLFKVNTDGSGFATLRSFNGTDGDEPGGGVVLSGTTLYGVTAWGGRGNRGVVFAFTLPFPVILSAPQSQTAEIGSTVRFRVSAAPAPLSYLWCLNGTNISAAATTNAWWELTNVQDYCCGAYTVVATNGFGAVTSAPAMLNVILPVPKETVPAIRLTGDVGSYLHLSYADTPGLGPSWRELGAITLTTTPQFYPDISDPLPSCRFYRTWQTNVPSVPSALQMSLATALTLKGAISSKVRVDYINRIGPTDAWVTLDTVTLTNTSELYFDTSAWGQPQRLYRLIQAP
jgi:uncharacterized repeat protein (TIGR03803 family)